MNYYNLTKEHFEKCKHANRERWDKDVYEITNKEYLQSLEKMKDQARHNAEINGIGDFEQAFTLWDQTSETIDVVRVAAECNRNSNRVRFYIFDDPSLSLNSTAISLAKLKQYTNGNYKIGI